MCAPTRADRSPKNAQGMVNELTTASMKPHPRAGSNRMGLVIPHFHVGSNRRGADLDYVPSTSAFRRTCEPCRETDGREYGETACTCGPTTARMTPCRHRSSSRSRHTETAGTPISDSANP